MKNLFMLLLLAPLAGNTQCPQLIGKPYANSKAFIGLIEQRLSIKFTDSSVMSGHSRVVYNDPQAQHICRIEAVNDSVQNLYFETTSAQMDVFVNWFEKEFLNCAVKKEEQTITFPDCIVQTRQLPPNKRSFVISTK